jgi:hypothetical protein
MLLAFRIPTAESVNQPEEIRRTTMLRKISIALIHATAILTIVPANAGAENVRTSLQRDLCNPPQGLVAQCNKQAGGSCDARTGYWTVGYQQIALKNQCVWEHTWKGAKQTR